VLVSEDCYSMQVTFKYIAAKQCTGPAEVAQIHRIAQNLFFSFIDT